MQSSSLSSSSSQAQGRRHARGQSRGLSQAKRVRLPFEDPRMSSHSHYQNQHQSTGNDGETVAIMQRVGGSAVMGVGFEFRTDIHLATTTLGGRNSVWTICSIYAVGMAADEDESRCKLELESEVEHKRVLDANCAFLYGKMRRRVHIELLAQDPQAKGKTMLGRLVKAMYGVRDVPHNWSEDVGG